MKKIRSIFHVFFIVSLLFSLSVFSVASHGFNVGCKVGDWAEYVYKLGFLSEGYITEEYTFKMTVTAINESVIEYEITREGLQKETYSIDIKSTQWLDIWGYYQYVIAGSLEEGDKIYDAEEAPVIQNVSERVVAGATREVSYVYIHESPYGGTSYYIIDFFYDKATGFMVNITFLARGVNYEIGMIDTNMWQPEHEGLIDTLTISILVAGFFVVIIIVYYFMRKSP